MCYGTRSCDVVVCSVDVRLRSPRAQVTELFAYRNYEYGLHSYSPFSLRLNALTLVGNTVGAFLAVYAPSAVTHEISTHTVNVSNSIVAADIAVRA